MIDISVIDNFISQHGQFSFLDWLLDENKIPYADYEAWRYGGKAFLDDSFTLGQVELEDIATKIHSICGKLGLSSESCVYYQWGGAHKQRLQLSESLLLNQALESVWISSKNVPQMDLFMDNTPTILENQVVEGLANRNFSHADKSLEQLSELNSSHKKLGSYRDLINYGFYIADSTVISVEALGEEFNALDQEVSPLVKELLGSKQRDFLSFAWRRIADNYANHPDADNQIQHLSYALMHIPDWVALKQCLEQSPHVYQSAELMARLAHVYSCTQQAALFVLMWGKLFERFPSEAEEMLGDSGTLMKNHWDGFLAFDEDWSERYFLAYLVIQQPGLVHWLDQLPQQEGVKFREAVNEDVVELVRARLDEKDEKQFRSRLKGTCPAMLNCYLNKRDWQASLRRNR